MGSGILSWRPSGVSPSMDSHHHGGPAMELPSLWRVRVKAESTVMMPPGKTRVTYSVGQLLYFPHTGQGTSRVPAYT